MLIKCTHCGAPLEVPSDARIVHCQYCRASSQIAPNPPPPSAFAPYVQPNLPPQYGPPQPFVPPPGYGIPVQRPPIRSGAPAALLGCGISVLAIGGVVASFALSRGVSVSNLIGNSLSSWNPASSTCEVDANGDAILDLAGLSGTAGDAFTPTIVDGATGKVLWKGENLPKDSRLFCLSSGWFGVTQADFKILVHNARKPDPPIRMQARDKVGSAAMGVGCAAFETDDGSRVGVQLPAGTASPCTVPAVRRITEDSPGILGLTTHETSIDAVGRTYLLRKRAQGTQMLTVEVQDKGKTLWSKELPYASPTFDSAIAVGQGRVYIWAAQPASRESAVLVGLDATTGNQLFAAPMNSRVSNSIDYFKYNGKYVVGAWWVGLHAYDPSNGKEVWLAGSEGFTTTSF